jgi:hypothetical protein
VGSGPTSLTRLTCVPGGEKAVLLRDLEDCEALRGRAGGTSCIPLSSTPSNDGRVWLDCRSGADPGFGVLGRLTLMGGRSGIDGGGGSTSLSPPPMEPCSLISLLLASEY